jgi:transcriptional regulator with XRE-family HTH domain
MAKPSSSHSGNPLLLKLGCAIRAIRTKKGLSQEEVALISGLDRSYLGGIERGQHNVAIINLQRIASALDVEITVLFDF